MGDASVGHIVVLVSHHLQYPPHTPVIPIQLGDCPHCRFVYFRLTRFMFEPIDPYREILKPLQPWLFRFSTPEEFRKALAGLMAELSARKED